MASAKLTRLFEGVRFVSSSVILPIFFYESHTGRTKATEEPPKLATTQL